MKLVIVESPAKAKTISKFLGKDYEVVASYGHIRDLPSSADEVPASIKSKPWARLAVDVDNDFQPYYVVQKDSKKRIAELKKRMKDVDEIVLATDEDREGESISWHLVEALNPKVPVRRIVFHEITKSAIAEAIAHPREVDQQLVRAQESRRILDRLYGYSLSPVLWKKVRTKLSAGRVQSVAVRLVVEREEERRAFRVARYWDLEAELAAQGKAFTAALVELDGKRVATGKDFDAGTGKLKTENVAWLQEEDARALADELRDNLPWRVSRVEQKETKQKPYPPFITSTLQQAASSQLGFTPSRTMQVAQRLYEGVDLGGGEREGLITYMRTDSVTLSNQALGEAGRYIEEKFGAKYHQVRRYTTKSKSAQEAHEAIRPTHPGREPEQVARFLGPEEQRLYDLIWRRTLASQMADAILNKTGVDFTAASQQGSAVFRATGSVVVFPGFLKLSKGAQSDTDLPPMEEGQEVGPHGALALEKLSPILHETKPPARFTEASLVRQLEEEGIGRPSTYAPTIGVIQQRGYVSKKGNALVPTFVGIAVTLLLREHFGDYVDLKFTARMENALDDIASGAQDSVRFLAGFYRGGEGDFGGGLEHQIKDKLPQIEYPAIPVGTDPDSGEPIVVRLGRAFPFLQRGEGGENNSVSLPEEVSYEELTLEKALELLKTGKKTNESLGTDPATGLAVYKMLGPYGPYVQLGEQVEKKKPKRASLPKGTDLEEVTLETALRYLALPREVGTHPEREKAIHAAIGRFGPYVVCDGDFRSLPDVESVFTISLDEAVHLLSQPKRSRATSKKLLRKLGEDPESGKPIELYEGRYGPYVSDGEVNASIPKSADPETYTLDAARALLREAADKKPAKKRPAKRKTAAKKKPAAKKAAAKKAPAKRKPAAGKKPDA